MTDQLHLTHLGACRTAFERLPVACGKILLVGEDNPISAEPEHALYPYPEGCAGNRLMKILNLGRYEYLGMWRTNLCVGKWSMKAARDRANKLVGNVLRGTDWIQDVPWSVVVMLGRKVATAFGYADEFFTSHELPNLVVLASIPHPSGRNLIWNEPGRADAARTTMTERIPTTWTKSLYPEISP